MSQNTVTKESLTSVINGLFQSIEAENEEKRANRNKWLKMPFT